jgi:hypothetical protein
MMIKLIKKDEKNDKKTWQDNSIAMSEKFKMFALSSKKISN